MIFYLLPFLLLLPPSAFSATPLLNNTIQTITITDTLETQFYSFTIPEELVPLSVNILLEGNAAAYQAVLYLSYSSSSCVYTENPDSSSFCASSGYGNAYSLFSMNFLNSDTISIGASILSVNSIFKLKVLAYPLLNLVNGSNIRINSLDSSHTYVFNRYYQFFHDITKIENIYVILEGSSATDTGALYLSANCTNKAFTWFPSSMSNYKGSTYSDKRVFLPLNLDKTSNCLVTIGVAITTYNTGLDLRILSYPIIPLTNNTEIFIDSLNSTNIYNGFYRYFSFTTKNSESPGSLHFITNGDSSTDTVRVFSKTSCSNTCVFSYFPDSLANCFATTYANPYQILTIPFDSVGCFVTIAVLIDSFNLGMRIKAIIYPQINLKNNTYATIVPININSNGLPFWRYFYFSAKFNGSLNILLEGLTSEDIGGAYANTDCESGCAFSNFPSKFSNCYHKYESQKTFVTINLYSACNISFGVYITKISASINTKVVLYSLMSLPNGSPVLIDSLSSKIGYELFYRYYQYILKESDAMGNLTITLEGISNGDPNQLFVSTNCEDNCTYNPYPSSSTYCYYTTYSTASKIQIYLRSACTISIAAYISSYKLGAMLKATYYNICPNKIPLCTNCNISAGSTTLCYGCTNYYAANPNTHLSCQFCNITAGFFVDEENAGFCTKCQENCYNCTNGSSCLQCKAGYLLNRISATESNCQSSVSNCSEYYLEGGICKVCEFGFGLFSTSNICIPCILENCLVCSFNGSFSAKCDQCSNGMIFKNDFCQFCPQLVANCSICQDSNICSQCLQGFYLNNKGKCLACGDNNTTGCTICSSDYSCSKCIEKYYLADNGTCVPCKYLYSDCILCDIEQQCTQCSDGFYFDSSLKRCTICDISNCSLCSANGAICEECKLGFSLSNGTCEYCDKEDSGLTNCMICDLNSEAGNVCRTCKVSFYNTSLQTCGSCYPNSATCQECDNITHCTKCENSETTSSYLVKNSEGSTCVQNCPVNTILNISKGVCESCDEVFGHGCVNCSANSCTKCGNNEAYLYRNSCSFCNETGQLIVNSSLCFDNPVISGFKVENIGFFVNIQINCLHYAKVFFVYGLLNSIDGVSFESISHVEGLIPTSDTVFDWKGYGSFYTDIYGFFNKTLNGPFKNNGQMYKMKAWCQTTGFWGKMTTNASLTNWTQKSNGAKVVKISIDSSSYITFEKKPIVAQAIQKAISMTRGVYTENGIPAANYVASRILQHLRGNRNYDKNDHEIEKNSDIYERNNENEKNYHENQRNSKGIEIYQRNLQNYLYNYSFYIVPDYKLAFDYMEDVVNSSLQNSTVFAINIQNYVRQLDTLSTISLSSVTFIRKFDNKAENQAFLDNYPQFTIKNQTIICSYIVKETGVLYLGAKIADSSYTVNSDGKVNANLTWVSMKNQLDYNGNELKAYKTFDSVKNVLNVVNLSNLVANTTYFVFYGAGNEGMPENLTEIMIKSLKTGWLQGNETQKVFSERIAFKIASLLVLIMVFFVSY